MRMRLIGTLLIFISSPCFAQTSKLSNAELCARAQTAFRRGVENKTHLVEAHKHFTEATDAYRELHERGIRSPALYLSLGNAAVLANRWPEAIGAYDTGLKLDPNDASLREHLAFARAKVIYPPAGQGQLAADVWPAWLHRPTIYELTCIVGLSYILAWLAGTCAYSSRAHRLGFVGVTVGLVVVTAIAGAGLWHQHRLADIDRETPLVVIAVKAEFYRGNGGSYPQHPVLPVLPRGLEVRQLHRRGSWLQVRLNTGEVGWVASNQVLVVEP